MVADKPNFHNSAVSPERPVVRVLAKESQGFVTLSCWAHGFYSRPISISWLKKGHVQAQETKWGSVMPNGEGTYCYGNSACQPP